MHILLLTTGGTIASKEEASGLAPVYGSQDILAYMDTLKTGHSFDHETLMDLDSSNIQPEEWRIIARHVYASAGKYDGIIITHGTDTMAYTAAALSFMLQNLPIGVVLTGAQLPIDHPLTDAITNLSTAIAAVECGTKGISIAFNRKIIRGTRAVKVSTMGFDAFESVNAACLGEVYADGVRQFAEPQCQTEYSTLTLQDKLCTEVFVLKLIPGTNPRIFDALADMGYKGIIIEAFGTGGLHYIHRDLLEKLESITKRGVAVVICSQCLYERSDLSIYEVGRKINESDVISGADMTTEAAATKLMWALGQTDNKQELERIFQTNYAGEITIQD